MPYIKPEDRVKWKSTIDDVVKKIDGLPTEQVDGELNYLFSSIVKSVYKPKYFNFNRAIGMLECVRQEFYRKFVAPYEDKKEEENGKI